MTSYYGIMCNYTSFMKAENEVSEKENLAYKEEKPTVFANIEKKVLAFWQENKIFNLSIGQRSKDGGYNQEYVFFDGPPFANGLPHYGHLLTGFVKDAFARYHTMLGKKVERRFGWDCHGLPAEMESEKELNISGRNAIKTYGIDKFNQHCKESVMRYTQQWVDYVNRQARWVDFQRGYKTMDVDYIESVMWAFKTLYNKGLLYEDYRVMPYSWKCESTLSNFETRMDNSYRKKTSKSVTVRFELESMPAFIKEAYPEAKRAFLLVWTTTPWTLPSNLALAVNKDMEYAMINKQDSVYILAKDLQEKYEEVISKME
jgi:isoleucyl-tRNA synthetase